VVNIVISDRRRLLLIWWNTVLNRLLLLCGFITRFAIWIPPRKLGFLVVSTDTDSFVHCIFILTDHNM